jgi:hypothetical protein
MHLFRMLHKAVVFFNVLVRALLTIAEFAIRVVLIVEMMLFMSRSYAKLLT